MERGVSMDWTIIVGGVVGLIGLAYLVRSKRTKQRTLYGTAGQRQDIDAEIEPLVSHYKERLATKTSDTQEWEPIRQEIRELNITDEQRRYLLDRIAEGSKP